MRLLTTGLDLIIDNQRPLRDFSWRFSWSVFLLVLNPCSTWLWPCDRVNIKIQIFQKFLNSSFFGRTNSPINKSKLSLNLLNLPNFSQDFCTWMMKEGNSNLVASASTEEIYLSLKILSTSCSNVGTENFLLRMWSGDKQTQWSTDN